VCDLEWRGPTTRTGVDVALQVRYAFRVVADFEHKDTRDVRVDTAATSHATFMASVIRISLVGSIRLVMLLSDTATDSVHATARSLGLLGCRAVLLRSQGRTLHRFQYCGHMFPAVLMSRRMPRLRIVAQTSKMKAEVPARPGSWTSLPRRGRKASSLATKLHQYKLDVLSKAGFSCRNKHPARGHVINWTAAR
jgi:hypothetical protein